ncbi:helix-turn-helix domain-containing protein [Oceanobacillus saliphilus]|uniref:helix-turn-helix domain-containing protein n=1 Tax=Oceanobacillus saliphilus TaxID=2925834 RepID=UPI00201DA54D|nr:helix-turn-helix domain-containing protein [Oceanobacillus saliphilus]
MDVGAKLKEARLASGLSLDSLQETTKIQKRYLVAIEEGNLHILPGKFYARAFIKEYANAVGVDSSELLEEYKEEIPNSSTEENVQYTRIQRTRKANNAEKGSGFASFIPSIIVVLLIIGILFVAWWFIRANMTEEGNVPVEDPQDNVIITNPNDIGSGAPEADQNQDEEDGSNQGDSEEEGNTDESEEEGQPEVEISVVEEGTGSTPESTLEVSNAGDEIIITLESTEVGRNTWLEVRDVDNNAALYNGSFDEGASPVEIDASGTETVYFNIGYAPALRILINGVELEYPVEATTVHQKLYLNINETE